MNNTRMMKNEKGVALVLVMWTLLALSIIAIQLCQSAKMDVRSLASHKSGIDAETLALSAMTDARSAITNMKVESEAGGQAIKNAGGETLGSYSFTVIDESGRMDLNRATPKEISTLLRLLGASGSEALGAKISRYRDNYPDKNMLGAFELLNVDGISESFFAGEDADNDMALGANENDGSESYPPDNGDGGLDFGLSRYVRAGCPGKLNLKLATRETLLATSGLSPETAALVMNKMKSAGDADGLAAISQVPGLDPATMENLKQKMSARSSCFRIKATGTAQSDGYYQKEIEAYIHVDDAGQQEILYWRES